MLIFDIEIYRNYFLASFMNDKGQVCHIEMRGDGKLEVSKLAKLMRDNITLGFNSNSYDLYMVAAALENKSCVELKALSNEIIPPIPPRRHSDRRADGFSARLLRE